MSAPDLRSRALGAYLGLAAGDALGATVEFMTPREIHAHFGRHRNMVGGGWLKLKAGQVTDDTQMSLALGQAIVTRGGWDVRAGADSLVAWMKSRPVDIGNTCRRGIRRYMTQGTVEGPQDEHDAGNGACMRNLPITLATLGNDEALVRWTVEQCHLTHHNSLSDAGTVALGRMVHRLLLGGGLKDCRREANRLLTDYPVFRFDPYPKRTTGYIVDTLQTVLYFFFRTDCYEDCLTEVVNQGGDADTTGALAGMLAGAAYGMEGIPRRWIKKLDPAARGAVEEQALALLRLAPHTQSTGE